MLGKTGLNLLLITLLVTPVRQLTGFTYVLRIRRMLGLFAFFYILLHFLLYISYQGFDLDEIVKDVVKRPFVTVGFVAPCPPEPELLLGAVVAEVGGASAPAVMDEEAGDKAAV